MKNITTGSRSLGVFGLTTIAASLMFASQAFAYYTIDSTLDFGDNNRSVTNLQIFLKDNPALYPSGLVTGYFGGLTQTAVQSFQVQKGIVSSGSPSTTGYGRVGPSTQSAFNALINAGGWGGQTVSTDVSGPSIYSVDVSKSNISATFNWNTNELASAKVFYNVNPITMNEGDINSVGFVSTNGSIATNDNMARTSQQVIINNLQPNTRYYYVIVSTDLAGNISVVGPNNTFVTNQ